MKNKGFTLVELMIVIAIIAIIAAVAIPSLIRSKMSANESSAVASLKTIATASIAFAAARIADIDKDGQGEFPGNLSELFNVPNVNSPPFLPDQTLAETSEKSGYQYNYQQGDVVNLDAELGFTCQASPKSDSTGILGFYIDESITVRYNNSGTATVADPPLA